VKLATLSQNAVISALHNDGLKLKIGQFNVCIASSIPDVAEHLLFLYNGYETVSDHEFIDFYTSLAPPSRLRRYLRAQVSFSFDGYIPFKPLPYKQASAFFEWGLNWCIANHSHQYLIIHAAVVEYNQQAFIFPGTPGSGKSTLCAALVCRGWRLLSDEMALLSLADGFIYPAPRPISLKNRSIDVIRNFSSSSVFGKIIPNTSKGAIGHLRPPDTSIEQATIPAKPTKLIFPKYQEGSKTSLTYLTKSRALLKAAENCFNYNILGIHGFDSLGDMLETCECYEFEYSCLEEAVALFVELAH